MIGWSPRLGTGHLFCNAGLIVISSSNRVGVEEFDAQFATNTWRVLRRAESRTAAP